MRTFVTISMVLAAVLVWATPASAEVLWDGSGDPVSIGYVLSGATSTPFQLDTENGSPQPGVAFQDTTAGGWLAGYYKLSGATADGELSNAAGWTVETRVQTLENNGDYFGMWFAAEDDVGGLGLLLHPTSVDVYPADFTGYPTTPTTISLSDSGYHTIAITVAAGATSGHVFVDGHDSATVTLAANWGAAGVAFGDGSGGSAGKANWDYVNINAVPEPSTFALLASGLFGLLCYAWRKQK